MLYVCLIRSATLARLQRRFPVLISASVSGSVIETVGEVHCLASLRLVYGRQPDSILNNHHAVHLSDSAQKQGTADYTVQGLLTAATCADDHF